MNCDNPKCKNYTSAHDRNQKKVYVGHIGIYLLNHEKDIASSINDYGDLRPSFNYFIGREPKS